jgi:protein tyrosine phosphatase (PTP) superfamily phosphohydrolase (DUF442 family)
MYRPTLLLALVACTLLPSIGRCGVPTLEKLKQEVARLDSGPRRNATTWLQHIQREQSLGHPKVVARRSTELSAELAHALDGVAPGTAQAWGALVHSPEDILPVQELHNVELAQKGILVGGSQPENAAWDLLKRRGIRTVVNLRQEDNSEKAEVERHGLIPFYIPVVDQKAPSIAQARQFVKFVNDPTHRPVFVHCREGVGRTHTMIAAWRIASGWDLDDAIAEGRTWGLSVSAQINFLKQFAGESR